MLYVEFLCIVVQCVVISIWLGVKCIVYLCGLGIIRTNDLAYWNFDIAFVHFALLCNCLIGVVRDV